MKSITQHLKQATYRADRHEGKGVTNGLKKPPPPPKDLPEAAREIWKAEVGELFEATVIAAKDLPVLRDLVMQVMYMRQAEADLKTNGLTIKADLKAGQKLVTNPAWRIYQDAQKIVLQIRKEFGCTPLSGQRMTMPEPPKPDPLADLFYRSL